MAESFQAQALRQYREGGHVHLFHGTTRERADILLNQGKTGLAPIGANQGRRELLYVTTQPTNALWFAQQSGDAVVLHITVPVDQLRVDPEDGLEANVDAELDAAVMTSLPASLAISGDLLASAFADVTRVVLNCPDTPPDVYSMVAAAAGQADAYAVAVAAGRKREALRILHKAVGITEIDASVDRGGAHSPASPGDGSPLYDVTRGETYPEDVYSAVGLRYYGTGEDAMDAQAYETIRRCEGAPNRRVTIYRAVHPDEPRKIRPGDWVTTVRRYAKEHGESTLQGNYRITSKTVHARDIFTAGDSWLEWGYHPQESKPEWPTLHARSRSLGERIALWKAREARASADQSLRFSLDSEDNVSETASFRAWFGNSQITDSAGNPLIVFHGTAIDKTSFRREGGAAGVGIYFTPDHEVASDHAEMDGSIEDDQPFVMAVYLSIQNPFHMHDGESNSISAQRRDELESMGYDGVIGHSGGNVEYIAFRPEQVKSAIGNMGAFNPSDPDIRHSLDLTDKQAFETWFGNSHVVDSLGVPLVVYHGTNRNFEHFEGDRHFFTDSYSMAQRYGERVIPAFLRIQRPVPDTWVPTTGDFNAAARAAGFDGYSTPIAEGATEFVVFSPDQIKIASGNYGAFIPADPDIRHSLDTNDQYALVGDGALSRGLQDQPFFSALSRSIEGMNVKAMSAAFWNNGIQGFINSGVVKVDEVEWSGLREWLGLQNGRVTKQQVLDYLDGNGVQVTETMLGGEGYVGDLTIGPLSEVDSDQYAIFDEEGRIVGDETFSNDRDAAAALERIRNETPRQSKYSSYRAIPGGENYRELLLTLPESDRLDKEKLHDEVDREYRMNGNSARYDQLRDRLKVATAGVQINNFTSPHWDQPNVLAHIRMDDRVDANGCRVLFVHELQSDWGQQGKREGFANPAVKARLPAMLSQYDKMNAERRQLELVVASGDDSLLETQANVEALTDLAKRMQLLADEMTSARGNGLPTAPFVTHTDKWLTLALKRITTYAAQNGYDRVAFATGEQAADMFDLSKQVELIDWKVVDEPATGATRRVFVKTINREASFQMRVNDTGVVVGDRKDGLDGKSLDSVVGKAVAARIMATPAGEIKDQGLEVGSEGIRTFYDKIVPAALTKLLAKVGGGGMTTLNVSVKDNRFGLERDFDPATVRIVQGMGVFTVTDDLGGIRTFESFADAQQYIDKKGLVKQPGFEITPSIIENAGQGLPMFSEFFSEDLGVHRPPDSKQRQPRTSGNRFIDNPASWVIRERLTGRVIMETFEPNVVASLNTVKYESVSIYEHLVGVNRELALQRWFGSSKIADESGKPLVVFHGSHVDFSTFQLARDSFHVGPGMNDVQDAEVAFFTTNRKVASTYGKHVMAVHLSVQNPLVIDAEGRGWSEVVPYHRIGEALAGGHDGVIVRNVVDVAHHNTGSHVGDTIIVFHADQIKSVEVRHTPDADIRASLADAEEVLLADGDGPLTLFHGTAGLPDPDRAGFALQPFEEFSKAALGRVSESSDSKIGFWFTSDLGRARAAAEDAVAVISDDLGVAHAPYIYSVQLRARNPFIVPSIREHSPASVARAARKARAAGFDAVIFNSGEMGGSDYLVFEPDQVVMTPDIRASSDPVANATAASVAARQLAFQAWFQGSRVVDTNDKPLRCYHGTIVWEKDGVQMGDVHEFDRMWAVKALRRAPGIDTIGSWFSDNPGPDGAGKYAASAIYPVYLAIRRPWVISFEGIVRTGNRLLRRPVDQRLDGEAVERLRDWMRAVGYDGIAIQHDVAAANGSTEFEKQNAWIALEPTQIKSAISNFGTFDPSDPDIRHSLVDDAELVAVAGAQPKNPDVTRAAGFRSWFGQSRAVDGDGRPVVVYRGEHGTTEDGGLQTFLGTYTFTEDPAVASVYATQPNDWEMRPEQPRVIAAYLAIKNPIFENRDDPFLDLNVLVTAMGLEFATQCAIKHQGAIMATNNWEENYGSQWDDVASLLGARPDAIHELYLDAYRVLDDADFIAAVKAAGFDGAIHVGNGESARVLEFRVFDETQVQSALGDFAAYDDYVADVPGANPLDQAVQLFDWSEHETAPVGSWVRADYKVHGVHPVYQVRDLPVNQLYLPELDGEGNLQPEKRRYLAGYTQRAMNGEVPPRIYVIEMESGILRVTNGTRRVMSARAAGKSTISALLSPLVQTPEGKVEANELNFALARHSLAAEIGDIDVAAGMTRTAQFMRWFGDSRVVDDQGAPMVMYHGTPTPEPLTSFAPGGRDGAVLSGDVYGVASYFTSSPGEASAYAVRRDGGAVLPVYISGRILDLESDLSIEDALRLSDFANKVMLPADKARFDSGRQTLSFDDLSDAREFFEAKREDWVRFGQGMDRARPVADASNGTYSVEFTNFDATVEIKSGKDAETLFKAIGWDNLVAAGFDGLMMRRDGGARWVVMHNTDGTIKSAIGNSGEFSPYEADIRSSLIDGGGSFLSPEESQSDEFSRWFAGSLVTHPSGRPMVVYHGTTASFSKFDVQASFDGGFHFGTAAAASARIAYWVDGATDEAKPNIMPVYLSIVNPMRLTDDPFDEESWTEIILRAKSAGHDGIVYPNSVEGGESWVAFRPEQVKSAIGNSGVYNPQDPDVRHSLAEDGVSSPVFFSQLERVIEGVPDRLSVRPASQWASWLDANASKLGVKKDEITWSGIDSYLLTLGDEKVSRQELVAFVQENGVKVTETWLMADSGFDEDSEGAVERAAGAVYEKYTLPGGQNYRELLLTLPETIRTRSLTLDEINAARARLSRLLQPLTQAEYDSLVADGTVPTKETHRAQTYQSSHWSGHTNVLAHIRLSDRNDVGGKRVLFVEEIQSDWGQDGKKRGFNVKATPEQVAHEVYGRPLSELDGAEHEGVLLEVEGRNEGTGGAAPARSGVVPQAPFVTATEKWLSLALKRVITIAAQEGYDKVAFVTGAQSAELYDLRKQVDRVEFAKLGDDSYHLRVITKRDINLERPGSIERSDLSHADVEKMVGKDIARRIVEGGGDRVGIAYVDGKGYENRRLSGDDLKVGGEGLLAFYDKIVPQVAGDVLKRIAGGRVEEIVVVQDRGNFTDYSIGGDEGAYIAKFGGESKTFSKWGDASQWVKEHFNLVQPGFAITDAMREKLLGGVPLFSVAAEADLDQAAVPGPAPMNSSRHFASWFSRSKVVDADGAPLIVYHGTRYGVEEDPLGFSEFEVGDGGTFGAGIYFGGVNDANGYADPNWPDEDQTLPGRVYPVYLSLQRPLEINASAELGFAEQVLRALPAELAAGIDLQDSFEWPLKEAVEKAGYDGIIATYADGVKEYVAYDPSQVKSALGNIGTYSPHDPDIRHSETGGAPVRGGQSELERWIAGSVVVDADGAPLTLFHGTNRDFTVFEPSRSGWYGAGIYFSDNEQIAEDYGLDEEGGSVMRVHLRIERPYYYSELDVAEGDESNFNLIRELLPEAEAEALIERLLAADDPALVRNELQPILIAKGHDGLIVEGKSWDGSIAREYVVFSPLQVKSALGNFGTYAPHDPDIRHSQGGDTGACIVAHHGTNQLFDVFDASREGQGQGVASQVPGFWFAEQPQIAGLFGQHVRTAMLQIERPFEMGAADYLQKFNYECQDPKAFRDALIAAGYDGLVILPDDEYRDGRGPAGTEEWGQRNYVAFHSTQITLQPLALEPSRPHVARRCPSPDRTPEVEP